MGGSVRLLGVRWPFWLFEVAVVGGFGALLCGALWALAWSGPSARTRPRPIDTVLRCVPIVIGLAAVFMSGPSATDLVALAIVAAVFALAGVVVRRRHDADLTGVALSPGWGIANTAVRLAAPIATLTAAAAALIAVAAMAALGGPC